VDQGGSFTVQDRVPWQEETGYGAINQIDDRASRQPMPADLRRKVRKWETMRRSKHGSRGDGSGGIDSFERNLADQPWRTRVKPPAGVRLPQRPAYVPADRCKSHMGLVPCKICEDELAAARAAAEAAAHVEPDPPLLEKETESQIPDWYKDFRYKDPTWQIDSQRDRANGHGHYRQKYLPSSGAIRARAAESRVYSNPGRALWGNKADGLLDAEDRVGAVHRHNESIHLANGHSFAEHFNPRQGGGGLKTLTPLRNI